MIASLRELEYLFWGQVEYLMAVLKLILDLFFTLLFK